MGKREMKARMQTVVLIIWTLGGVFFFCGLNAAAAASSLSGDNVIVTNSSSRSDFGNPALGVHSWQGPAEADTAQKAWNLITANLKSLPFADTTSDSQAPPSVEKDSNALDSVDTPIPGSKWILGLGIIGLVLIRGSNNCRLRNCMPSQ
jgi:hypothetical protein